jgi:hypothetical protein
MWCHLQLKSTESSSVQHAAIFMTASQTQIPLPVAVSSDHCMMSKWHRRSSQSQLPYRTRKVCCSFRQSFASQFPAGFLLSNAGIDAVNGVYVLNDSFVFLCLIWTFGSETMSAAIGVSPTSSATILLCSCSPLNLQWKYFWTFPATCSAGRFKFKIA